MDPTTTPVAYCNNAVAVHCVCTTSCVATYLKLICIHTGQHRTQETTGCGLLSDSPSRRLRSKLRSVCVERENGDTVEWGEG